jgi:membrane protease YdiL (CAAX protease family)
MESVDTTSTEPPIPPAGWRDSRWLFGLECALIALIFYADDRGWIPISKTPELLVVGWLSLRLRRLRWRDVGLKRSGSWLTTLALGVILGAVLETFQLLLVQPFLSRVFGQQPDLALFRQLTGNLKLTLLFIGLSWTLAAFGEEMFWRGYLMSRVAGLFGSARGRWAISLILTSVVFGLAHGYQGVTGWVEESLAALILGLFYLGTGRNLWMPIIAHGVCDTIDMVLLYYGKMPGAGL